MKKYDLWYSKSEHSYAFFESGSPNEQALAKDAELVWSVNASNWTDACTKQHEYLGWEPYEPMEGD
ncbi:MAG: hypothetical protein Tsb002_19750 [Wenzhouxiangellaceae bacterium]